MLTLPPAADIQTLSAFADDHPPMKELLNAEPPDLVPHAGPRRPRARRLAPECGDEHEIPGYMTPFVPSHRGFYVNGEFLLMRPRYTDFDYAVRNFTPGLGTIGPIEEPLRYGTGTGLHTEDSGTGSARGKWETVFGFTYFTANGDTVAVAAPNQVLLPTLTRPGLTDRASAAWSTTDLDYQVYDVLVARRVLVDEHFAVRALGGVRFADLRQIFNTSYDGVDARQAAVATRSRFQGAGPVVGVEAILVGCKGFHLYSRAYGAMIAGLSNTNRVDRDQRRRGHDCT